MRGWTHGGHDGPAGRPQRRTKEDEILGGTPIFAKRFTFGKPREPALTSLELPTSGNANGGISPAFPLWMASPRFL
jgi:hypothetical protein